VFFDRGLEKRDKGDNQGAIADYDQAIKLKPDYAYAYHVRGSAHAALDKKQAAIADFQKATDLYRKQGNNEKWLQEALNCLKQLQP
jgi:tetratricopeptide (TPR) repeat protein